MSRVSLVVPNYRMRELFGPPSDPPLAVGLVAAVLEEAGHEVQVVEADALNLSVRETVSRMESFSPTAVGISCNYITKHHATVDLAKMVKQVMPVPVFVGGNHASAYWERLLRDADGAVDLVIRGEGERASCVLMETLDTGGCLENVHGACLHGKGAVGSGPAPPARDLDALPIPAYHLLPMEVYRRYGLVTSRGCPYRCAYCASTAVAGRRVRLRSPDRIAEEIEALRSGFGERFVWFSDDTFTAVGKHVKAVTDRLARVRPPVRWSCLTSAVDSDAELLAAMKEAGCEYVSIGVESTHPSHRRFIGKRISDEIVLSAVSNIHGAGLRAYGFFIIGFPGENHETLESRFRLIEAAGFDGVAANLLVPLPGTALWDELTSKGLLDPDELDMDCLFARTPDEEISRKTAMLIEGWTDLDAETLVGACETCRSLAQERASHESPQSAEI